MINESITILYRYRFKPTTRGIQSHNQVIKGLKIPWYTSNHVSNYRGSFVYAGSETYEAVPAMVSFFSLFSGFYLTDFYFGYHLHPGRSNMVNCSWMLRCSLTLLLFLASRHGVSLLSYTVHIKMWPYYRIYCRYMAVFYKHHLQAPSPEAS